MRKLTYFALMLVTLSFAACNTSGKMLKRATKLESKGQYYEAAMAYIGALKKNPEVPGGRDGLRHAGDTAIVKILEGSTGRSPIMTPEATVAAYRKVDELYFQAKQTGTLLTLPQTYEQDRRAAMDVMIQGLVRQATSAAADQKWELALSRIAEAGKYDPTEKQKEDLAQFDYDIAEEWSKILVQEGLNADGKRNWAGALAKYEKAEQISRDARLQEEMRQARANVLQKWAEDDLRYNRFRSSYDRALAAQELNPRNEDVKNLMAEALSRGARNVAIFPFVKTAAAIADMPKSFVQELNDELQFGYWAKPPVFIRTSDPRDIRRELRKADLEDRVVSDDPAFALGRKLSADFVVFGEVTRFVVTDKVQSERERSARTYSKTSVKYKEATIERKVEVTVSYRILDIRTRKVYNVGSSNHLEMITFKEAQYMGDAAQLDLDRSQRALFNGDEKRVQLENLVTALVKNLSKKTGDKVYGTLLEAID